MARLIIMFFVALFLLDAAILGNIGSILGALIDPGNMNDISGSGTNSTGSSSSSNSSTPTQSTNPNAPNFVPPSGFHGSTF